MLYPITRIFGPVFSDWLCEQINAQSASWLSLEAEWESRIAETEADLLGMRILVTAGYDPRAMLRVWDEDGVFHRVEKKRAGETKRWYEDAGDLSAVGDEKSWLDRNVLVRNHPRSDKRYLKIKKELETWQRQDKDVTGESMVDYVD